MPLSFLDCQHLNLKPHSAFCQDCEYFIYMSLTEYLKDLRRRVDTQRSEEMLVQEIRALEKELGVQWAS